MSEERHRWQPATAAQKSALDSEAQLLFFGGSAGSLKSATLLMDAAMEHKNKNLRAIIFRSSYAEITDLLDKTNTLYPPLGGKYNGATYTWKFASGAQIRFGYIKTDEDWRKYLGPRYCVAKGTPVLMGDGSYRSIEAIRLGDEVETLEGPRRVSATHGPMRKECVRAVAFDALGMERGSQIHPEDHRILLLSGEWGSYASLRDGQTCCGGSDGYSRETGLLPKLTVPVALHGPSLRLNGERRHLTIECRTSGKSSGLSRCKYREHRIRASLSQRHILGRARSSQGGSKEPSSSCGTTYALPDSQTALGSQENCPSWTRFRDEPLPARSSSDRACSPSRADVAERIRPGRTLDGTGTVQEHTRYSWSYAHPYTDRLRHADEVQIGSCEMTPVGKCEVWDLTVDDCNHYITQSAIVNQNSFIGWDESTMHSEKQVRNLLGRLSSTDKTLRLRCRLGSNPGGPGASWHQEVFLRGHCPVHFPEKSAIPGQIYTDRYWPSDHKPIRSTVTFVPGRLSDHRLLDADYALRLDEMEGSTAQAMLQGCWCSLEGAYYGFLNRGMIRPLGEIGNEWWYSHFLSLDFGYSGSSSSCGLYVRSPAETGAPISIPGVRASAPFSGSSNFPNGRIRKIGEIVEAHLPAYEFARKVVDTFIAPGLNGNRRRIVAAYLDPSNFKNIGDGHTIADQINEIFEPWDIVCEPASNDRAGGWQLLYKMLRTGEFEITDVTPKTYEALRTRMHDPAKPNDIRKIPGDPLDDVADETRYALYTFIQQSEKPRELRLQEALQGIDRSTREGMTSSAIRYQQAVEQMDAEEAPIRMSRGRTAGRRL